MGCVKEGRRGGEKKTKAERVPLEKRDIEMYGIGKGRK